MRYTTTTVLLTLPFLLLAGPSNNVPFEQQYLPKNQYFEPLPVEEAIKTIEVPKGYHLECVASEPMVQEPASFAFDEDGALYVCEWLTYMQDEYATGQKDKVSRVVKLVDTDGDGKMDKRTVFIDNILLPRNVLPMGDKVYVILTDSNAIWAYYDKDGDGVSDGREMVYSGGEDPFKQSSNKGNIEHQSSGLLWNLDNYIYNNYARFKYDKGKLIPESHSVGRLSQWGLARDDDGRIYCTQAGGHVTANHFQLPGGYPVIEYPRNTELGPEGDLPFSICRVEDQSSGNFDFKNKRVLTEFSACCGQTVLRSPLMPEFYGNSTACEPVARLIRMLKYKWEDGIRKGFNQFPGAEFIRSSDPFFRPVWTEMGPDGCFYFSDLYRGIIQEKNWFPHKGDHIWVKRYERVKDWGMLKVFRHGRIYRLVPDDKKPLKVPKLLGKTSKQLVKYLESENGWVRDNAQKLIVLRAGKSALRSLNLLIRRSGSASAIIGALWSLEGLDALKRGTVEAALTSKMPRVRRAAVQLAEKYVHDNDQAMIDNIRAMSKDEDNLVRVQAFLAFDPKANPALKDIRDDLVKKLSETRLVQDFFNQIKRKEKTARELKFLGSSAQAGAKIYDSFCFTCHGKDGKGQKTAGGPLAPSLSKNRWFYKKKDPNLAVAIILKGEVGDIGGKHYGEGMMISLENNYNDQQIADVLNYIGKKWNRWNTGISNKDVARIRKLVADRKTPYTQKDLTPLSKKLR